ncbi:retrovirus-related Pol polyprotein from transposon opus [Trichonephila clavipes]|nr:retrovirus-related Pol polyprotein from transposon opus [Trichonephila clavipes]
MGASNCLCIQKKNGSIRLCVDYRHLNSFTIGRRIPYAKCRIFCLKGQANYITVLDLTKGYWQIPMAEEAKPYTAFCDSSWSLPILCYALRDEERREYLSKVMDQVLVKHRAYCRSYRRCSSFLQNMGTAHETSVCISNDSKGRVHD